MKTLKIVSGYRVVRVLSGRSKVFLVENPKLKILVDSGPSWNWRKLKRTLYRLGIDQLDFLVLTHAHYDHAGNAFRVKETFNAKVIMHHAEAHILQTGISVIPNGTNWLTRFIVNSLGKRFAPQTNYTCCKPDILVDEFFYFGEYGLNAMLLHTPGHTAGSISLIVDDEIALVGDAMFGVFPWSVFPPYADNVPEMIKSWGKLLDTNCQLFFPAHGTEKGRGLVTNGISRHSR